MNTREKQPSTARILTDKYPDEDAFGGHQRIAKALHSLIEQEEEGKAIALLGDYGSGKSTVIKFLGEELEKKKDRDNTAPDTRIFTFDAWEHQGDSLRRAFLEEYIDFFEKNRCFKKDAFKEDLEYITKRREKIETTSEPIITKQGGLFAFLLLLVPLGMALARYATIDKYIGWAFIAGVFLIFLPIIHALTLIIFHFLKSLFCVKEDYDRNIFHFLLYKSNDKIKSKLTKTPEPTSIEFQNVFKKVTKHVLANKNRQLIVVIDNIDRLTSASAIKAWSTLSSFFDNISHSDEWHERFWLITPFDDNALKTLWANEKNQSENDYSNAINNVQSFIDKTFDITFRVSRPILSDWKTFFKNQFKYAFPNCEDERVRNIAALYQLIAISEEDSPTPRDLKKFINRVHALYRVWQNEPGIDLTVIAYYELLHTTCSSDFVGGLRSGKLIEASHKSVLGVNEINTKLAALHFNCDIKKAPQVLYKNEITKALEKGNASEIESFVNQPGFNDVLPIAFHELNGGGAFQLITSAAKCLDMMEKYATYSFDRYYQQLADSITDSSDFNIASKDAGEGLVIIWEKKNLSISWIEKVLQKLSSMPVGHKDNNIDIESWYSMLRPVFIKITHTNHTNIICDNFKLPGDPYQCIDFFMILDDEEKLFKHTIASSLKRVANNEDIENKFKELFSTADIPDFIAGAFYLYSMTKSDSTDKHEWSGLTNHIKSRINENVNIDGNQLKNILVVSIILHFKLNNKIIINPGDNFTNGLFACIAKKKNLSISGLSMLASVLFNPLNAGNHRSGNAQKGLSELSLFLKKPNSKKEEFSTFKYSVTEYDLFSDYMRSQLNSNILSSLTSGLILALNSDNQLNSSTDSSMIIEYFDEYKKALEEHELTKLVKAKFKNDNLLQQIQSSLLNVEQHPDTYYYLTKACPPELQDELFISLANKLVDIDKNTWLNHLKRETTLLKLIIEMQRNSNYPQLGIPFKDALLAHFNWLYKESGQIKKSEIANNFEYIISCIQNDLIMSFLRSVKDIIEDNDGDILAFNKHYQTIFQENDILLENTSAFVRKVLTKRVVKSERREDLDWLLNFINNNPEVTDNSMDEKKSLNAEVKDRINNETNTMIKELLINLKKALE